VSTLAGQLSQLFYDVKPLALSVPGASRSWPAAPSPGDGTDGAFLSAEMKLLGDYAANQGGWCPGRREKGATS